MYAYTVCFIFILFLFQLSPVACSLVEQLFSVFSYIIAALKPYVIKITMQIHLNWKLYSNSNTGLKNVLFIYDSVNIEVMFY